MSVSISQYIDLLFKKLQGVAKTANSTVKIYSNESIASPPLLRGDVVWMQAGEIPAVAGAVANIANARINANAVQCVADTTVPPIGGVRPTWLTSVPRWIPQEFGATWQPRVYVGPPGAANIQATGTQIFSAGVSGTGEYYFDTQAGVLNFIGETIPGVLSSGNVVYVSGYEYVGALGVGSNPGNITLGNLTISNTQGVLMEVKRERGVTYMRQAGGAWQRSASSGSASQLNSLSFLAGVSNATRDMSDTQRYAFDFDGAKFSDHFARLLSAEQWATARDQWLPTSSDGDFIASLMEPCWERGKYANWIAAPKIGIDNRGGDFEYVKIHRG
jgi:hypothetical protein